MNQEVFFLLSCSGVIMSWSEVSQIPVLSIFWGTPRKDPWRARGVVGYDIPHPQSGDVRGNNFAQMSI